MLFLSIFPELDSQSIKIISFGAIGVAVIILLIITIVLIAKRKKKSKSKQEIIPAPAEEKSALEELPADEPETAEAEEVPADEPETVETEEEVPADEPVTAEAEEVPADEPETAEAEEEIPAPPEEPLEETPEEEVPAQPELLAEVKAEENDEADERDEKEEKEEDETVRTVSRINGHVRYIIIKYNKSFTAKIIQGTDEVKNYYSILKNELLSYKGVKARMSWKGETFYSGRTTYAKLCVRGKSLGLFLALNAKDYEDTKYILDDMSEIATYEKTPCLYRIKNDRRVKYSAELIATVMGDREKLEEPETVDWASKYPYEETQPLVDRGLIKELTEEDAQSGDVFAPRDYVAASEVDELLQDDVAVALVEESDEISDKTKSDIVNIDTLAKYFEDGETVTLEEMKKRIPSLNRKTTFIKVLARGTLDKKLTVIADSFSIQAVKMILLTGGNAVRKKNS